MALSELLTRVQPKSFNSRPGESTNMSQEEPCRSSLKPPGYGCGGAGSR